MDLLIIAANARSLIANRGDLIRELRGRGLEVGAAVPTNDYLPEVEQLGIAIFPFDLGRTGMNPWRDLGTIVTLYRLLRRVRPQRIFSYGVKPVVYSSLAAGWAGVPQVYAMITGLGHAYTTMNARTRLLRFIIGRLYRLGLGRCTRVFFQNPDDLQEFISRGILSDEGKAVRINGSGINLDRFRRQPLPNGPPVFLFIGRLLTEKGIAEFVDASELVHRRCPDAQFVAVGPHDPQLPHSVSIRDLEKWRAAGVVEFVGGVKDVRPWLRKSSVFVLPSYREGTPRSVLEAMSTGRPVVTSDAPGCRETVVAGENGFLVAPGEPVALAQAMMRFIEDPSLLPRMADNSYRIASQKYDVRTVNRAILREMDLI